MTFQPSWYIVCPEPEPDHYAFYINGIVSSPAELDGVLRQYGEPSEIPFVSAFRYWTRPVGWGESLLDFGLPLIDNFTKYVITRSGRAVPIVTSVVVDESGEALVRLYEDFPDRSVDGIRQFMLQKYEIDVLEYEPIGGGVRFDYNGDVLLSFGRFEHGMETSFEWNKLSSSSISYALNPSPQAYEDALQLFATWMGNPRLVNEINLSETEDAVLAYLNAAREIIIREECRGEDDFFVHEKGIFN